MKMLATLAAMTGLLLSSVSASSLYFMNTNWTGITAGKPYQVLWAGDGSRVNISLYHGPSTNMQWVRNITTNQDGNSFEWYPKVYNTAGNYSLRIFQRNQTFSSPMFLMSSDIAHIPATLAGSITVTALNLPSSVAGGFPNDGQDLPKIIIEIQGRDEQHAAVVDDSADAAAAATVATQIAAATPLSYNPGGPVQGKSTGIPVALLGGQEGASQTGRRLRAEAGNETATATESGEWSTYTGDVSSVPSNLSGSATATTAAPKVTSANAGTRATGGVAALAFAAALGLL